MKNGLVAKIFYEIADMLEIKDIKFKPEAYRKAARSIESMSESIEDVAERRELEEIPGVGESIERKIEEILDTGELQYHKKLKKSLPIKLDELNAVEGVGPKKIKLFYKKLKIKSLKDLERAAKKNKLQKLPGMGKKSEEQLLENIEFVKTRGDRKLLGHAMPIAEEIVDKLSRFKEVEAVALAGSIGRRKETIGDIDILVATKRPIMTIEHFVGMPNVAKVVAKGRARSTVRLEEGIECDLRVIPKKSFGSALMYFTGSKQHNIALRRIAIKRGWKLSEYGLFSGKNKTKQIAGRTERQIYTKLGMQFIPPEIRENEGEIELAMKKKLPRLINYGDVLGDLQMHTGWSDGANTVVEMAMAAKTLGHKYVCITDHVGNLRIANGIRPGRVESYVKKIKAANRIVRGIRILKGAEVDIKSDGKIDVKKSVLDNFDIVVASVHYGFRQPRKKMTQRIIAVMENDRVNIIGHPTNRLIQKRKGSDVDIDALAEASKRTGTLLEINAYPNRLDLNADNIKRVIDAGCKMVISTDSHSAEDLEFMRFGEATARRGWAQKKDVVNTLPLKKMLKKLKK